MVELVSVDSLRSQFMPGRNKTGIVPVSDVHLSLDERFIHVIEFDRNNKVRYYDGMGEVFASYQNEAILDA